MKSRSAILAVTVLSAMFLASAPLALGENSGSKPRVIPAKAHDVSQPLRDMVATSLNLGLPGEHEIENRRPPQIPGADRPSGKDAVLQKQALPLVNTTPGLNFEGIGSDGYAPPDTDGAVGSTQYVQMTNVQFAVYDKATGNIELGPALISTVWSSFSGDCAQGDGGDPVVVYDKAAQRWVLSQLNVNYNAWCMAVSTTSDATGTYNRYEFSSGTNLPDYPKLGVWPDGYYWSSNTFANDGSFLGADVCAFDRSSMLSGGAANAICMQQSSALTASLLPSDLDGTTPPAAGEPNFYLELFDTSDLALFKFHVDFSNPANSTFTGPTIIPVATFSEACSGSGGTCIPQPDPSQTLDSLGDRLMFRLAYRNFGDHEALVVTHSVTAGSSAGVRWYEIRSPNGTPVMFQQGTFAPDAIYRWMASAAMDSAGDIALGYSVSSSSVAPSIRYTGRLPSDAAGMMQAEANIVDGTGSQNNGVNRWGDYSTMTVDPLDDCTFWYTTEYMVTTGSYNWNTRIANFKFPNCGNSNPGFYLSENPPSQIITNGQTATYTVSVNPYNGYNKTVAFAVSGCPPAASCTVSPSSSGSPNYPPPTVTISTNTDMPGGNYTVTVAGTDGTITHTTSLSLVVTAPDFSLAPNTSIETIEAGTVARFPITLTPLNTFSGKVKLRVSSIPTGSVVTFSVNPVTLTSPNTATSMITVATKRTAKAKTYVLKITGTSGLIKRSTFVTLVVNEEKSQPPATTVEEPCLSNHCLFYSGDYDDNGPGANSLFNGYVPSLCVFGTCGVTGIIYIPFEVPKREWNVEGLFLNTLLQDAGLGISVTSADWSIVRGFKVGGLPAQLSTVCSGTAVPTVTPTGRTGAGISEYTLLITGTKCPNLETGTYWMTLVPTTDAYPYATDVEDNTPTNVVDPGMEPPDKAGWYAPAFGYTPFFPTAGMFPNGTKGGCGTDGCDRFSAGIIGTLVR